MKIGLTYTGSEEKNQNYINWLKGNDDIEVIRLSTEENNAAEIKSCDALVLSGGIDIDPVRYGNKNLSYQNAPEKFQPERDEFETALFNDALKKNIPVLGICRGSQLINCILGGNMKQDLGVELNRIHKSENNTDKLHEVKITEGSLLSGITQTNNASVNSAHHQAIDQLAKELVANCKAEDGTIEGFEWKDKKGKPFMLAVQWHPERMYKFQLQDTAVSKNIRDRFIAEIKNQLS